MNYYGESFGFGGFQGRLVGDYDGKFTANIRAKWSASLAQLRMQTD